MAHSAPQERWGHDVLAAPDGDQAWAAFQHEAFPVVISDWMMPGLDGLELVRRIRYRENSTILMKHPPQFTHL
ncbi:MAG: response regulator [Terriglobia bacterium]